MELVIRSTNVFSASHGAMAIDTNDNALQHSENTASAPRGRSFGRRRRGMIDGPNREAFPYPFRAMASHYIALVCQIFQSKDISYASIKRQWRHARFTQRLFQCRPESIGYKDHIRQLVSIGNR
jgi:hypothetical protein